MEDLHAWAVWRFNDVDLILLHPNFSAYYIENQSFANKLQLDQQLAEFRSSFIQLLQKEHQSIKKVISKVIDQEIIIFTKIKDANIFDSLIRPCCHSICLKLMGVSNQEAKELDLFGKTSAIFNMTNGSQNEIKIGNNATLALSDYFQQLCTVRRQNPGNDLISAFVQAEKNNGLLISPLVQLCVGICASVPLLLGTMLFGIYQNPQFMERLRSEVRTHSNELLRYAGPAQYVIRYCISDCTVNGHHFHKGDQVALFLWSANRDSDTFYNPDTLDLNRPAQANMSFGKGVHACLGASIVREISIYMMETMLENIPFEKISWSGAHFDGSKTIKGMCFK